MRRVVLPILALPFVAGCQYGGPQSMFGRGGPAAEHIEWLWWLMFGLGTLVFVLVLVALWFAVWGKRADGPPLGSRRFIVLTGIAIPAVVFIALLVFSLRTTLLLRTPPAETTIEVIGHQFWWEVRYPSEGFAIANEIYIPIGRPVHLRLLAEDVIHSFWVPSLHGKMDMLPDFENNFWIQADRPGRYRGQCAEFCGVQHAMMAFWVIALEPSEYDAWVERRRSPSAEPTTASQRRGLQVFNEAGCRSCHAIAGIGAEGQAGPELTDFAERQTLAAGTIANTRENLEQWISDPQSIKRGNLMPATHLSRADMDALLDYLHSLR
jgi:cytochrome c oxidase subunit II